MKDLLSLLLVFTRSAAMLFRREASLISAGETIGCCIETIPDAILKPIKS